MHYRYNPDRDLTLSLRLTVVDTLTPRQREALLLWLDGYTQKEIGERYGISQAAVHYRLSKVFRIIEDSMN